jgi:virulence-associated protein VapD
MATEERAKKVRKKNNFKEAILGVISAAGVVSVAAVAPNALKLLSLNTDDRTMRYRAKRAFSELVKKGLIEFSKDEGRAQLSAKGEAFLELEKERFKDTQKKGRKWDGQWRVVIFDRLRAVMQEVGFKKLQSSVWIYPYDCEELLTLIRTELHIGKEVQYLVVSALEGDETIRAHFKLKKS